MRLPQPHPWGDVAATADDPVGHHDVSRVVVPTWPRRVAVLTDVVAHVLTAGVEPANLSVMSGALYQLSYVTPRPQASVLVFFFSRSRR